MEKAGKVSIAPAIEPLLTTEEVARIYRVTSRTIERWRNAGVGPKHIDVAGGAIRYSPDAVRADIAGTREPHGEVAST